MAQVHQKRSVRPGTITMKSVTDGFTHEALDDGMSPKSGISSIARRRIERALKKKSKLDNGGVWRVVDYSPPTGCEPIDTERREWTEADDKRLEAHLAHRDTISAGSKANSVADAEAQKAKADRAQEVQDQVQVAVQTALALKAADEAAAKASKPAAKASKS